jgi:hypothetical protein
MLRISISLIALGLILMGAAQLWISEAPIPGVLLILIGLATNTILAVTRFRRLRGN